MSTQQTDRDLLQLAAKAAGIKLVFDPHGLPRNCTDMEPAMNVFTAKLWNPLEVDGDALRLAAKLRLDICRPFAAAQFVCVWVDHLTDWIEEPEGKDACAATRRAITRAAAEIGKAMP
jgi:hypothetical protein